MIDSFLLQAFDACKTGNQKTLKDLIQKKKVQIDATLPFTNIFGVNCINASMLQVACAYGRLNTVDYLLTNNADINYREGNGHYALHFAALGRHNQIVEMLLRKKANAQCKNFQGFTPLHFGCKLGGTDSIKSLIQCKAVVDAKSYAEELTPLHVACENSRLTSAQVLLDFKADINALTVDKWTPLHYACNVKNYQLVELLVTKGAFINAKTKSGDTPLHFAARAGSYPIIKLLIERGGKVSEPNGGLDTPLIFAAAAGDERCFSYLLEKGAKIDETNSRKQMPIHQAVTHHNKEIVKILMERGANPNVPDIYNNTALGKARLKGYSDIVEELEKNALISIQSRLPMMRHRTQSLLSQKQKENDSITSLLPKIPVSTISEEHFNMGGITEE